MNTDLNAGFTYLVEVVGEDGVVREAEVVHNIMPLEGLNHTINAVLKGGTQITTWYVGIYEGNYTPVPGDNASTFPTSSTECTAYAESVRQTLTLGSVAGGAVDNTASKAAFTMNAAKTVYGGFISSASAKSATSGTLLSAVRFSSPKVLTATDVLRVTAGFTLASL